MSGITNGAELRAGQGNASSIITPSTPSATIGIDRTNPALLDTGIAFRSRLARVEDGTEGRDPQRPRESESPEMRFYVRLDVSHVKRTTEPLIVAGRTSGMRDGLYSRHAAAITTLLACCSLSGQTEAATPCRDCTAGLTGGESFLKYRFLPLRLFPALAEPAKGTESHLFFYRAIGSIPGNAVERRRGVAVELDHGTLSLDAGHGYTRGAIWKDARGQARDRLSAWALGLRYRSEDNQSGAISLGLESAIERRRFASDLSQGRWSRSSGIGAEVAWEDGERWRVSAGYAINGGDSRASGIRRSIELAEGAPATAHGYRLALDFSPTGFADFGPFSFGVELRQLGLSKADMRALGSRSPNDRRLIATLTGRF